MTESRFGFLQLEAEGWRRNLSTSAPVGEHTVLQRVDLARERPGAANPVLRFRGNLDRPPFAEITEVNPLPPTRATTELYGLGQTLRIEAPALPAIAEIRVAGSACTWHLTADRALLTLGDARPGRALEISIACSLIEAQR